MKNKPETREEWITYGNRAQSSEKRKIAVVEISISEIDKMWDFEYQAKKYNDHGNLQYVLASNSLNNLKKEIKRRKWKLAYLTTITGSFSSGQYSVEEYPFIPRY